MTTIATDGKSVAGDSQTSNGHIFGYAPKVFQAPDGRIFGACGDTAQTIKFRRWMLEGGDAPELKENFCALILNSDGTIDWIDEDQELVRVMAPFAIGTGEGFAIGAMEVGSSPEQAVVIAAKRDTCTGGKITVIHLEQSLKAVA